MDEKIRIAGGAIDELIRQSYRDGGSREAVITGRTVLTDVTDDQIMAIAIGAAGIVGVSPHERYVVHGVGYNDDCDCALCQAACNVVDG